MSLSNDLKNRLSSQAVVSEIDEFADGDADLRVTLDIETNHVYHIHEDSIYQASLGLEVTPDLKEMMFIVPISHSNESEILYDLENASRTEITAEIGDWDHLLE